MSNVRIAAACVLAACAAAASSASAQSAPPTSVVVGVAHAVFNAKSSDLAGPPGTTPPGVTASVRDVTAVEGIVRQEITGPWSLEAIFGVPPKLDLDAGGTAAALGKVATARAWFPALLLTYSQPTGTLITPFVGAGIQKTWYTSAATTPAYDTAVGASSTHVALSGKFGPVARLGARVDLGDRWILDVSYARFWIHAHATLASDTPGIGEIPRTLGLKATPNIVGLMIGRSF